MLLLNCSVFFGGGFRSRAGQDLRSDVTVAMVFMRVELWMRDRRFGVLFTSSASTS